MPKGQVAKRHATEREQSRNEAGSADQLRTITPRCWGHPEPTAQEAMQRAREIIYGLPPQRAPRGTGRTYVPPVQQGWVYFIGSEDGPVKIGFSTNVESRLAALQTASPDRLHILARLAGTPVQEREMHARYAAHRKVGEWFTRHPDILAEIARLNDPRHGQRHSGGRL